MLVSRKLPFLSVGPAPGDGPPMQVIRDSAGIDALSGLWFALSAASESPVRHHAWTRAAAATFCAESSLHVIVLNSGASHAILPLVRTFDHGPHLEMLGARELNAPADALYSDRGAAVAMAEAVLSMRLPVLLRRCPADSMLLQALDRAGASEDRVVRHAAPGHPSLSLDPTWREPERHFGPRRRARVNRARQVAEAIGPVESDILAPSAAELPALLDEFFRLVGLRRHSNAAGAARIVDPHVQFYRRLAANLCQDGLLRIALLRIDDRCVAMQLAVEYGRRFWLLKAAYNPAFVGAAPSTLLQVESIRYAATADLRSYEFLGMNETSAKKWGAQVRPCVSLGVYPGGPIGKVARWLEAALD
jgi:CelD/BcsL family acetyltransferase involved in cellulose biosynthesis